MFDSKNLLSNRGPVGAVIWTAAYFFKKLKKTQVSETDISASVDEILQKEIDVVTYRILACLLLGVVRIYSKKVDYLLDDCNDVIAKLNGVFGSRKSRKILESLQKRGNSITLPKRFELDAFELETLEEDHEENVAPREEITLKDDTLITAGMELYSLTEFSSEQFTHNPTSLATRVSTEDIISSILMDIDASMEKVRDFRVSQEEWVTVDTFYEKEDERLELPQPSCEDYNTLEEPVEIPMKGPSEDDMEEGQTAESFEDDRFFEAGGEEPVNLFQLFGDGQNVEEDDDVVVLQPNSEIREDTSPQDVTLGAERSCGSEETTTGPNTMSREEYLPSKVQVEKSPGYHRCESMLEQGLNLSVAVLETPQSRLSNAPGMSAGELMAICTPAVLDRLGSSRKRNCCLDEDVVIPNDVIKRSIADTSDLMAKRRKVPHTALAAWRASVMSNLPSGFSAPLLASISSELRSLFYQKKFEVQKVVPVHPRMPEVSETTAMSHENSYSGAGGDDLRMEVYSNEGQESGSNLMNEETSLSESDSSDPYWLSASTRKAVKDFQKYFEIQKKREEDEVVSLSRLLKGRTKRLSARLFYETLVLKTKGCVDVKQADGYADILVRKVPKWDQLCRTPLPLRSA